MKHLPVFSVSSDDHLVQPEQFHDIDLQSPALTIMTDFRSHKPPMVNVDEPVKTVTERMGVTGIEHQLVVDKQFELVGIINRERLSVHNLQLKHIELGLKHNELTLQDVMIARKDIQAVEFEMLVGAKISDVISSLREKGQEYLLVVDQENHHIRGVISAKMIAERLHEPLNIHRELTFIDIFTAIRAH